MAEAFLLDPADEPHTSLPSRSTHQPHVVAPCIRWQSPDGHAPTPRVPDGLVSLAAPITLP